MKKNKKKSFFKSLNESFKLLQRTEQADISLQKIFKKNEPRFIGIPISNDSKKKKYFGRFYTSLMIHIRNSFMFLISNLNSIGIKRIYMKR